jgi:hypothetical protein
MASADQVRAAGVIALLRAKGADYRQLIRVLGKFRQVLAKPQSWHDSRQLFKFTTIGMARFHIERVGLTGATTHP